MGSHQTATEPPCLSRTFNHGVEPVPHPTFTGGLAWTCPRCGDTFSEAMPTYMQGLKEACDRG